jgi:hypothetical protein
MRHWHTREDEFVSVICCGALHLGLDALSVETAHRIAEAPVGESTPSSGGQTHLSNSTFSKPLPPAYPRS